ncbi:hypothetical protein JNUCC1_02141 [Lentibacillus sp. JNUCC-1]|uniref:hypothetical protein n=1 Tax=Lentibacillus sp. JNUCC-1 TaxID=2654513 RepID=UPI0012E93DCF|nr:hypothetical protein [Lentibacillus sp. JNUCC-1]MUV38303.1 hypothetical protein [Lentibacillus sp. JNUCC-1]
MTVELFKGISFLVLVPFFLASLYVIFKFQWGSEGKDERGQMITNKSYIVASPILPIGWLIETVYNDFADSMPYEGYRTYIWVLILITFIVHGVAILYYKRKL